MEQYPYRMSDPIYTNEFEPITTQVKFSQMALLDLKFRGHLDKHLIQNGIDVLQPYEVLESKYSTYVIFRQTLMKVKNQNQIDNLKNEILHLLHAFGFSKLSGEVINILNQTHIEPIDIITKFVTTFLSEFTIEQLLRLEKFIHDKFIVDSPLSKETRLKARKLIEILREQYFKYCNYQALPTPQPPTPTPSEDHLVLLRLELITAD